MIPCAVLIIGPTGSGKSPLGAFLEGKTLWGRRCVHFDFGEELRRCRRRQDGFPAEEATIIREALDRGRLLEDAEFHVARRILVEFLDRVRPGKDTVVLLNGLPRHAGQARDVEELVRVEAVVHLVCSSEVSQARIRSDAGGDRAGRTDDDLGSVGERLRLFVEQTGPLVEYYQKRGVRIVEVGVTSASTGATLGAELLGMTAEL